MLWAVGIFCAVWTTRYLTSLRSRLLVIVLAVFLPVLGTVAVIVSFAVLVWCKRRLALSKSPRR